MPSKKDYNDEEYDEYEDEYEDDETYEEFLARTGVDDTEQHYQMFVSGGYTDDDYD